ncbi:unnamed protein product [marine sediment metagenome]|uniref:Uncharacterized protein n=1 Tax=marine sediment metagenome TaxID=412755 RepID=X1TF17_9ZZZZ
MGYHWTRSSYGFASRVSLEQEIGKLRLDEEQRVGEVNDLPVTRPRFIVE